MSELTKEERCARATRQVIRKLTGSRKSEQPAIQDLGHLYPRDFPELAQDVECILGVALDVTDDWRKHRMVSK
jgi:hypothetical protein